MLASIWTNPNAGIGKVINENKGKASARFAEEGLHLSKKYGARF